MKLEIVINMNKKEGTTSVTILADTPELIKKLAVESKKILGNDLFSRGVHIKDAIKGSPVKNNEGKYFFVIWFDEGEDKKDKYVKAIFAFAYRNGLKLVRKEKKDKKGFKDVTSYEYVPNSVTYIYVFE